MNTYSNPNLLNLQALFIDNSDSHARMGAHVRVSHHPLLELPVAPFILERADVDTKLLARLRLREDAVFFDQTGQQRIPPFSISTGDEITIKLPTGMDILPIWAEIVMDPGGANTPRADAYIRSVGQPDVFLGTRIGMPLAFSGSGIVRMVLRGQGTVVGVRWLNGPDQQKGLTFRPIDILNLPHQGGRRYPHLNLWEDLCRNRRDRQAPRRRPLQDTEAAPARFSAPPFSAALEEQRIDAFFDELSDALDRLIEDGPAQLDQIEEREMVKPGGGNLSADDSAVMRIRTLGLMLQAQADPGMASYLGYKTLDADNIDRPTHALSIYRVTGFFRNPATRTLKQADESGELFSDFIASARQQGGILSSTDTEEAWQQLAEPWIVQRGITAVFDLEQRPCLGLRALAVADHRAVLEPPPRPRLDTPEHIAWLPSDDIDTPRRVTETYVRGLVFGAALSATRRQPISPAKWTALNSALIPSGWRALILPNIPQSGTFTRAYGNAVPDAFLSDPQTGPEGFRMHVAQSDRFGRFSDWRAIAGDPGPRPKPPRPVVTGSYRQPDTASGSHQGTVTITIPLPEESALAPGAFPLTHATLSATHAGSAFAIPAGLNPMPVTSAVSIHPDAPVSAADDRRGVRISFAGPSLAPTTRSEMVFTATWHDSAGQVSQVSEPLTLTLTDPYPPAQTPIAETLLYSARPDATGKAWVERRWSDAGDHVSYAVYYADENRLRSYLADPDDHEQQATDLLSLLEGIENPAIRAGHLRAAQHLFPGYLFERLQDVILPTDATGQTGFRHALPGALRVLSAYKIVAEAAETAARPDLSTVDTVFYGVPNSDPPARPVITARQVPPEAGEPSHVVELTVSLRAGVTRGETVRLRRTRSGEVDALRNPIIGTTGFDMPDPAADADPDVQTATFRDTGPALIAPGAELAPFIRYAWIAEVQGAPEPGSSAVPGGPPGASGIPGGPVPGRWSRASLPATLVVIPDTPPVAPTLLGSDGTRTSQGVRGLSIDFSYPLNLVPTTLGPWTVVVDRRLPGQSATRMLESPAQAGQRITVPGDADDATFLVPTGTVFRLRLRDPLGRASEAVDVTI